MKQSYSVMVLFLVAYSFSLFANTIDKGTPWIGLQRILNTFSPAHTLSFDKLVKRSQKFNQAVGTFPAYRNRIQVIAGNDQEKQQQIALQAVATYPIMHTKAVELIDDFLTHKKTFGSSIEKELYADMSPAQFISRLLTQRPLMFMGDTDQYLLRSFAGQGFDGVDVFDAIGTKRQAVPFILKNYISYDEMQLAALLGVSVPTYFINNGNRFNEAVQAESGTYEESGVYVGLVGARFERPGRMEWQHMMVTREQNIAANGYGPEADSLSARTQYIRMWEKFYEESFATYEQAQKDVSGRFIKVGSYYLDGTIYKKRMQMVIEPFLLDANAGGKQASKKVYCHVVGLGIGVWAQNQDAQAKLIVQVYDDIVRNNALDYISDIDFSWFPQSVKNYITRIKKDGLSVHFSKRNPADKLEGKNAGKLLVAQYAWDGNAYPGNEYWAGALSASGDPAAACCSTIAELQNPLINDAVRGERIQIYGDAPAINDNGKGKEKE